MFWDIGYDVTIFVYDLTNQLVSLESNLVIDMVMWQKFGKCSVSMKEVINLIRIWPEQVQFYMFNFTRIWPEKTMLLLVQAHQFGTGSVKKCPITRHKSLKTKPYFWGSYRGRTW